MKPFFATASLLAIASLSGCGQPAPSPEASASAPATIERSDASASQAAMNAPTGIATAAAQDIAYACTPAMQLTVRYDNAAGPDGIAIVTLDGREYRLDHVQSGSGARYETQNGRTAGKTLVWWNKGRDGTLLEGKAGFPEAAEATVASCKAPA